MPSCGRNAGGHGFRISLEIRYDRVYEPYALGDRESCSLDSIVDTKLEPSPKPQIGPAWTEAAPRLRDEDVAAALSEDYEPRQSATTLAAGRPRKVLRPAMTAATIVLSDCVAVRRPGTRTSGARLRESSSRPRRRQTSRSTSRAKRVAYRNETLAELPARALCHSESTAEHGGHFLAPCQRNAGARIRRDGDRPAHRLGRRRLPEAVPQLGRLSASIPLLVRIFRPRGRGLMTGEGKSWAKEADRELCPDTKKGPN